MSTKLHAIDAEPAGSCIVEMLEDALQMAREGKLSSAGLAVVYRDGSTGSSWSDAPSVGLLIGAAMRLQHRLLKIGDE